MPPQIALQLYTLRDALAEDFPGTLARIAQIGYRAVETAFLPEHIAVTDAARMIRDAGLQVVSAHCELPDGDQLEPTLEAMSAYGCTYMIWHGWPQDPDYSTLDGVKRLAERYDAAHQTARKYGYRFGIHNHWWEMEAVAGELPYRILLQEMNRSIFFEVDTYWAKTAGRDPAQLITELGKRAELLHIKDGPLGRDSNMVAVGDGLLDFAAISRASNGAAKYWVVELDRCATNMFAAVERSYRYLTSRGLASQM